jgi:DNA-binding MarR family transcriptional regulator
MQTKRKARRGRGAQAAVSRLKQEIALNREFRGKGEAAFLALVWTWQKLESLGRAFFPRYGITDVQFNVLMILWDYRDRALRQHELAEILVVNRASAGGVIARLERAGWITRSVDEADTRARLVRLAPAGARKLEEVRGPYYRLLARIFRDSDRRALAAFIEYLDEIRARLNAAA